MTSRQPPGKATWPLATDFRDQSLSSYSALAQAQLIKEGELTSLELLEYYLQRIRRYDSQVHAFVDLFADRARKEAEGADKRRAKGQLDGPFHGVPTALKDHHMVRFSTTRLGSSAFDWLYSPVDDGVVRRLRRAGFLILGKTSMSELGLLPIVEPLGKEATANPWDLTRTAGGSSGGAGAAIAAGLIPLSPGSDGAGSVRIPAALNGLVGLKPTRGLVRDGSERVDPYGLTVIGPMARDLDDLTALLDVLASADGSYLIRSKQEVPPLRIGVVTSAPFGEIEAPMLTLLEETALRLQDLGHLIEWRNPPQGTLEEFTPLYQRFISRVPVLLPHKLEPLTQWFREEGKKVSLEKSWQIFRKFEALGNEAMAGIDLLLTPTVGISAPKIGEFRHLDPPDYFRKAAPLGTFTALGNITGQPGLSFPFHRDNDLPLGLQLLGRPGDDLLLIRLARTLTQNG